MFKMYILIYAYISGISIAHTVVSCMHIPTFLYWLFFIVYYIYYDIIGKVSYGILRVVYGTDVITLMYDSLINKRRIITYT